MKSSGRLLVSVFLMMALVGCGGSGSGSEELAGAPRDVTLRFEPVKNFHFEWSDVSGATHYQLLENPDGMSGFTPVGDRVPPGIGSIVLEVPLYARVNAEYILQACNATVCMNGVTLAVSGNLNASIGYFGSGNPGAGNSFGDALSLSADNRTLVVGAPREESRGDGNSFDRAGAVYVFTKNESGNWVQQAYLKASNIGGGDRFGEAVSLSGDGQVLAVGAPAEDSNATGVDGDQGNDSALLAGAVYVFIREAGGGWVQQAYLKASNTDSGDRFGQSVSLSAQGQTLAVGASAEDGVNNATPFSGSVYVFTRDTEGSWAQKSYLKASDPGDGDRFGNVVSLSVDGQVLAVGAVKQAGGAGAVYVFVRGGEGEGDWIQQAQLKASNAEANDDFGFALSLSGDGQTLAVGASSEDGGSVGVDGDQSDNLASNAGAVYIFVRDAEGGWVQQAYLKASNSDAGDIFGSTVSLSASGHALAIGAPGESGGAFGVNGNEGDNSDRNSGAVYTFMRDSAGLWSQQAYLKTAEGAREDGFGRGLVMSADGEALAVGAGLGVGVLYQGAPPAGAVYLY